MILMFGIVLLASGCTTEHAEHTEHAKQNETNSPTGFVIDLYLAVVKEKSGENIAVSPFGAEHLLDFVRAGAAGETEAEIERVLGKTEPGQWREISEEPLTTAAALWTQQGHPILPEFLETARKQFGASAEQVDFSGNAVEAVRQINAWCSEKTNGRIPTLFDRLEATTRSVLVGAIHFAADWKTPFEKDATLDGSFTLMDGTKTKTKIMSQTGQMKYGETDETLILEVPYKNDGYAMLLLLPKDAAQFVKWEAEMTIEQWKTLRNAMKSEQVDLRMPRFTMESDLTLNAPLKQLGMPTAFSRDADFSKIDGLADLYLSEVRQKTFVKVDETGTEAAAVTGAVIAVKSAPLDVKPFYADRPFVYAIVKNNTILFLGRFVQPEQKEQPVIETLFVDPGLDGEGGTFH